MRYPVLLLAGTVAACCVWSTPTIAQFADRPRPVMVQNSDRIRYFGITTNGNDLELDMRSIHTVGRSTRFIYYINGNRNFGFTSCRESVWYARGERIPAESDAARAMLNQICGFRATSARQRFW